MIIEHPSVPYTFKRTQCWPATSCLSSFVTPHHHPSHRGPPWTPSPCCPYILHPFPMAIQRLQKKKRLFVSFGGRLFSMHSLYLVIIMSCFAVSESLQLCACSLFSCLSPLFPINALPTISALCTATWGCTSLVLVWRTLSNDPAFSSTKRLQKWENQIHL